MEAELAEFREFKAGVEAERAEAEQKDLEKAGEWDKLKGSYEKKLGAMEKKHEEELAAANSRFTDAMIPAKIRDVISSHEREISGVDDIVSLLRDKFTIDDEGNLHSESGTAREILDDHLSTRPWQVSAMPKEKKGLSFEKQAEEKRDFGKAMSDPAYRADWKEKDPEGYAHAEAAEIG